MTPAPHRAARSKVYRKRGKEGIEVAVKSWGLNAVLVGLKLFAEKGSDDIVPEHDRIYAGHDLKLSATEKRKLRQFGWWEDKEISAWCHSSCAS